MENLENIYVYDFDETIYNGDSTHDFYKFCLKKFPKLKKKIFFQIFSFLKYILGFYTWTQFKENLLSYVTEIENIDQVIDIFWAEHKSKIKNWYLNKDHSQDVIISASPEFLLKKICYDYLNVKLFLGTDFNTKTGKINGKNCYGSQKVKKLNQYLSKYKILEFYSDSLSDSPLAELSDNSYIVIKDDLIHWNEYKLPKKKQLISLFFSREFIWFGIIGIINTLNNFLLSLTFKHWISNKVVAFWSGYLTSTMIGYPLNSFLVFKQKLSLFKYIKFLMSYIPNFLIQTVIVFFLCNVLTFNYKLVYLLASALAFPITFICLKLFTFKKSNKKQIDLYSYREK